MADRMMQILYPIADAIAMDFEMKGYRLYGDMELDLGLIDGIPLKIKPAIVSSVVDASCGTVGCLLYVVGNLYLGMIHDDRVKKLTFFAIDGPKAGFKRNKHDRVSTLDNMNQWSRRKFYALIAPGVKATFTRNSVDTEWQLQSVGPDDAMNYVKMREQGVHRPPEQSKVVTADDLNEIERKKRLKAITGGKK